LKKIILIVLIVIVIGGLGGGAGYYYLSHKEPVPGSIDPGDYFVTDIKGSLGLLKTDIILQIKDGKRKQVFNDEVHKIRNDIIFILRNKTEDELKSTDIEDTLSQEIIAKLNQEFNSDDFDRVFFNEFVIQ